MTRMLAIVVLFGTGAFFAPEAGRAVTITLQYEASGLVDENLALLETGDLVQLIYAPDGTIYPPNPVSGLPGGTNVLWQTITFDSPGHFYGEYDFDDSYLGEYVYVRFFNAPTLGTVTYYGLTPLHTLAETLPGFDVWDITPGGIYYWTEYPFVVIPEPETWLTLFPALGLGIFLYHRRQRRKEKCAANGTNS